MNEPKKELNRIAVLRETKREINLLAASEQRTVINLVAEMVEVYKVVKVGKLPMPKGGKPVNVAEVIKEQI